MPLANGSACPLRAHCSHDLRLCAEPCSAFPRSDTFASAYTSSRPPAHAPTVTLITVKENYCEAISIVRCSVGTSAYPRSLTLPTSSVTLCSDLWLLLRCAFLPVSL